MLQKLPNQHWLSPIFGPNTSTKPGLPLDVSQVTLFDSMYVHPMVRDSMIVWNFYHWVAIPFGCWLTTGTPRGMDQWVGQVPDNRFHASKRKCSIPAQMTMASFIIKLTEQ